MSTTIDMHTTKKPTANPTAELDGKMLRIAEEALKMSKDGTIGLPQAKSLFAAAKDGGKYTDAEKTTIRHIREHHGWTEEADAWYRTEVSKWDSLK